ncbi:GNAT family N-acetyltransferase [Brevibacillus sp. BC25]|uniref:GNAT family N-acetyltransferase n=1 Tax=Brevibacillus sp. BC25 TaxID=1144308 RepID=UPI0002714757|nr:GNAT family N-acetyltransferase [Brevibacillus sp. BC25]EJL26854.1 acetyltransferase, ribosomal protein N-acetylase [Brevibacillus sp. BC25]
MNNQILSARLTLTKVALPDWDLIRSIYSNPTLMEHIGATMSDEDIRRNFEKELAPWSLESTHWLTWIIRETDSGNDVGLISFCTRNRETLTAEVGFIILDGFKGKGYATEAIRRVFDFAVDTFGFKKFTAVCSEEHVASRRVLEKAGMKLDKIVPESTEIAGKIVNDCFYSLEK